MPENAEYFGTGRDAIRALIRYGIERRHWQRCFVPSYFCSEVTSAISASGIHIEYYHDSPRLNRPRLNNCSFRAGDVLLLVNYFGLRGQEASESVRSQAVDLLEDHTHDPWSDWARSSTASYCMASLRKTLPISDGALIWSPAGHLLPTPPTCSPVRETGSAKKFAAMILKRRYLLGNFHAKDVFRQLQLEGEAELGQGEISGISRWGWQRVAHLPWQEWRRRRSANHAFLCKALSDEQRLEVLLPFSTKACPFALVLQFDSLGTRDHMRRQLLAKSIYSAVHWPAGDNAKPVLQRAARLSERLLSLPCDFRYDVQDLRRVATAVRDACAECSGQIAVKEEQGAISVD